MAGHVEPVVEPDYHRLDIDVDIAESGWNDAAYRRRRQIGAEVDVVVLDAQDQARRQGVVDAQAGGPPELTAAGGRGLAGREIEVAGIDLGIGQATLDVGEPAP